MQGERYSAVREHSRGPPSFPWHKMSWNSTNISFTYLLTSNIYTVCTGFIRLDWVCISHYFSWLQSQVSSEFAADWNLVVTDGEKYCTEKQPVILCILCSVNHNTTLLHSSQPITLLLSKQPITQNMTNFVHWMTWKSLKMRLSSGREIQNIKTEKSRGKTGEGRVDKLGGHEWTNWGGT